MSALGRLLRLSRHDAPQFAAFIASFPSDTDGVHGLAALDSCVPALSAEEAIELLEAHHDGKRLPEGWVPSTTWFWSHEGVLQGVINLRHRLTPHLETFGGHIGYAVAPEYRRRGVATAMLAAVVEASQARGMARLLVTCDAENTASARTIEANGGRLEREDYNPQIERVMRWYWIALDHE